MAHIVVLLFVLTSGVMAFLPSPSPSLISRTHADITEEVVLKVAEDTCRAMAEAEGKEFIPPVIQAPEEVLRACLGVLGDSDGVSGLQFQIMLDEIITANILVDRDQAFSAAHHFNDEVISMGRNLITEGMVSIRASLAADNLEAARWTLGQISHTLQDFYSHSNWIELGNMNSYPNLLRPDLSLERLADENTPTCLECETSVCPNVILPNILSTGTLTSGYLETFSNSKPLGKCRHGDAQRGGINKDISGMVTPGGFDPHLAAYDAASYATEELLQNIRNTAGDELFLRMLGISRSSVVCFVVDTTGSMTDDINEVRRLTNDIIKKTTGTPNEPSLYILVQFNDPEVGPVLSTTNPEEMIQFLSDIQVIGGGDIPELSLSGLQLALTTAPPSSNIFVFTDAPAKDTELTGTVLSLIDSTKSKVSFLLTNLLRRRRRSTVTNPNNELYEQLAQVSGGQAIEVTKGTLSQATAVILDSITSSLTTLLQASRNRGQPETFSFLVDPSVQMVTIYITGLGVSFNLQSPSGAIQDSGVSGPLATVSAVGNLQTLHLLEQNLTGDWQIRIASDRPYNLRVTGRSLLDFTFRFVEMFEGPHPGFADIAGRPSAGENATLIVTVTGAAVLSGLELMLVDGSGDTLRNATLGPLGRRMFLTSVADLPNTPFSLLLKGENDGHPFQRQSSNQLQASQITVKVQITATLAPGVDLTLPFLVATNGIEGDVTIVVRDERRFVTSFQPSLVMLAAAGSINGSLSLFAPPGTPSGTTTTVTIEAESASTRQTNYALIHVFVVERITDLTPPVCQVLNKTMDCPAECGNSTWEVTLTVSDGNGTGIDRVFSRGAQGNLTTTEIQDESGTNVTLVNYSTSCCSISVDIIAVDVAGNSVVCSLSIQPTLTTTARTSTVPTTTIRPTTIRSTTIRPTTIRPTSSSPHRTASLLICLLLLTLAYTLI